MNGHTSTITLGGLAAGAVALLLGPGTALAGHDHHVVTPNGVCHQVAAGQTAIADADHGGWHQFHDNVHDDATDGLDGTGMLGNGNSRVRVVGDCP